MLQREMKGQREQEKWIGHKSQRGRAHGRYEDYKDILVNKTVCVCVCVFSWLGIMAHANDCQIKIMTHWSLKSPESVIKPGFFFLWPCHTHTFTVNPLPPPPPTTETPSPVVSLLTKCAHSSFNKAFPAKASRQLSWVPKHYPHLPF